MQELRLWPLCIKLMRFTQYDTAADVTRGWDLLLKDAVDNAAASGDARLAAACRETEALALDVAPSAWCAPSTKPQALTPHLTVHVAVSVRCTTTGGCPPRPDVALASSPQPRSGWTH